MTVKSIHIKIGCFVLAAVSLFFGMQFASAYSITDRCAGPNEPSWKNNEAFSLLCDSPAGYPGFPNERDSNTTASEAMLRSVIQGTFWQWRKDGTSTYGSFLAPGCDTGPEDGAWFDHSRRITLSSNDTGSEVWFEPESIVACLCGDCNASTIGCASQRYHCGVQKVIRSADIAIANDPQYGIIRQDSINECISNIAVSVDTLTLHEIGHTYTLGHVGTGQLSVMQAVIPVNKNCHLGYGMNGFPFPDDMNGLMKEHGAVKGSDVNIAGSAFYVDPTSRITIERKNLLWTNPGIVTLEATFSLYNYWNGGYNVQIRGLLVPINYTLRMRNGDWELGGGLDSSRRHEVIEISAVSDILTPSGKTSRDLTQTASFVVNPTSLVPGEDYRLYIYVDPNNFIAETDENDNAFPLDIVVSRTDTATGCSN